MILVVKSLKNLQKMVGNLFNMFKSFFLGMELIVCKCSLLVCQVKFFMELIFCS